MPFKPETREYRSFAAVNFRKAQDEEGNDREYTVEGYFTTFDEPYELWPGEYEVIDRHAFDECDLSDIIFQLNHDGAPLARNRNGSLGVTFDDHGGLCVAYLGGSQQGREVYESITNGLIDQMSFGFTIAEDGFEWDSESRTSTITKVSKVFDVSCVSIPANPGTEIHARSYLDGVIEAEKQELLQRERERRLRAAAALELSKLR